MAQWRIIDFFQYHGVISAKQGRLNAGEHSVPLSDISVVLIGPKCQVHASVLDRAAAFTFPILACDWRHVPYSVVMPWSDNTRVGARHVAQASLSEGRRKNAWMQIVKAKIRGQAHNLRQTAAARRLRELVSEVRSGDPTNCEAQAARWYWGALFEDDADFARQIERNDGRNAMLNYGYTILRGNVVRAIVSAGLWPTLGIWHRGRSNVFSLADDLVEPFRPAVDSVVMRMLPEQRVADPGVRQALVSAADQAYTSDGFSVQTHIERLCQMFAQYVEGEVSTLAVRSWGQGTKRNG